MRRAFSLGCAFLVGGLAACQQTWKLDNLGTDGSMAGAGGTSGGGKGGSGPSDASADGRCTPGPQLQYKPDLPQVVVLLDRSESMNVPVDSRGDTPLIEAESAIYTEVSNYGGSHGVPASINFAFLDFPDNAAMGCSPMAGCCTSDVTTNYSQFQMQAACSPSGPNQCQSSLRPIANALNAAQHYFMSVAYPPAAGERYVLLITADDPDLTCSSCIDAISAISNLANASSANGNATTEIVALASSTGCLTDLANAQHGVSPPPIYLTSPTNLGGAIHPLVEDISRDGCRLTLTTPPASGGVSVFLGFQRQSPDTGTGNGWVYDNNNYGSSTRVYLHGALCDEYLSGFEQLTIYDGCGPDHFGQTP